MESSPMVTRNRLGRALVWASLMLAAGLLAAPTSLAQEDDTAAALEEALSEAEEASLDDELFADEEPGESASAVDEDDALFAEPLEDDEPVVEPAAGEASSPGDPLEEPGIAGEEVSQEQAERDPSLEVIMVTANKRE